MFERVHGKLAPIAAHFVTPECCRWIIVVIGVDPDRTGLEPPCGAMRLGHVPRPNGGRKTVRIVVCRAECFFDVGKLNHGKNGPKNLLPRDGHFVAHAVENGRLQENPFPLPICARSPPVTSCAPSALPFSM